MAFSSEVKFVALERESTRMNVRQLFRSLVMVTLMGVVLADMLARVLQSMEEKKEFYRG